jgi:HEAT repeat protein
MAALAKSERAIMFLKTVEPSLFEFADPFLGVIPFSAIPIEGKGWGLARLESALGAILENHNFDDQVNAMRLLQGFDRLSPLTLARLNTLSSSSEPEAAVSAIAVLLTTKSADSVRRLNEWLHTHNSGGPPLALMSIGSELGQVTDANALNDLEGITAARYPSLRLGAVMGIRNIRNPRSARALVARLDDPDSNVRYLAVITLSEIFAKDGEYAPTMYLFDQNPNFYVELWKSWWNREGR